MVRKREGQARPGGATETWGEAGAWEGPGAPVGGGPRVSTQPCRGRGEGGVQMPGQRQRKGGSQKSGWGRLGKPPGDLPCGPADASLGCSLGLPGGWWGVPASSSSAVETGQVCLVPPRQQRRGPCSSVTVCPAASVSFQCSGGWLKSQVPCTLESVPLHLEMRSPWRGTRLPSRQPSCRCHLQGRQSLSARGVGWVGSVLTRAGL